MTRPCLSGESGCTITEPHRHEVEWHGGDPVNVLQTQPAQRAKDETIALLRSQLDTARKALEEITALPYRKFIGFAKRIAAAALKEMGG